VADRDARQNGPSGRCEHDVLVSTGGKVPHFYWSGCTACGVESAGAASFVGRDGNTYVVERRPLGELSTAVKREAQRPDDG
jgi:hypothetical protein